jgi:CheY-like chemotaxis protein
MNAIARTAPGTTTDPRRVVVVNGNTEVLEMLETALDEGRYELAFAEASEHAYSQIKGAQPDMVLLCLDYNDQAGYLLLSMLKLDPDTRDIPVVTCATDVDADTSTDTVEPDFAEDLPRPRMTLN